MDLLPSACIWAEEGPIERTLERVKETAFHYVDVEPDTLDAGLSVADFAAGHGIKFCVEHAPGRALARARDALAFVEQAGKANLYLLLDVGHTLLSKENA